MSLHTEIVWFKGQYIFARVGILNGRSSSEEKLIGCHLLEPALSPLALFFRLNAKRQRNFRFFALSGYNVDWQPSSLTDSMQRSLDTLHITPLQNKKYASHCLLIGVHIKQLLLVIPLDVRVTVFPGAWQCCIGKLVSLLYTTSVHRQLLVLQRAPKYVSNRFQGGSFKPSAHSLYARRYAPR